MVANKKFKIEKEKKFKIPKAIGMNIEEIKEPEEIDEKLKQLKKERYTTVVISNELASFSQDIVNKYKNDNSINIIIIPSKNKLN